MSKVLRQIINSGTKSKSGGKKTVRISIDIEYYEKIQDFCSRYNRKIGETLKSVIEEFVEDIDKSDPLVSTMISKGNGEDLSENREENLPTKDNQSEAKAA
jgi:macrodomain Ter protein organizer (MatP/YcbG family)